MSTFIQNLVAHPMLEVIGWSLVHFVWQAIAIAIPVAMILMCLSRRPARFRYLVACSGMGLMAIAPVVTALYVARTIDPARWAFSSDVPEIAATANLPAETPAISASGLAFDPGELLTQDVVALSSPNGQGLTTEPASWSTTLSRWFPAVVAIWIAGVLALSGRLACGLWRVGQWKRSGQKVTDKQLLEIGNRLAIRLGMKGRFSLLESARIKVPAVIGWLKPALIVPVGFACGMPPAELESLLAHEMAHIRRHDWLVNLFQSVVETVLFFHPAIWWISSVIREEREHCCDDIAIEACGDRIAFARALARLEESRCESRLAMSASGSSLVLRVRRILAVDERRLPVRWPAGLVSLAAVGLFVLSLWATRSIAMDTVSDPAAEAELSSTPGDTKDAGSEEKPEEDWPVHQPEVDRTNERTGQTHHVLAGIGLTAAGQREVRNDMMYSNVMNYSFIPESVAKELGAVELGVIDFGDEPPVSQPPLVKLNELVPPPPLPDPKAVPQPAPVNVFVDELTEPAGDRKIVPYADQPIHVPEHLAFYGMNRTGQKKFRVVRIEKVNLGLGPEFGPVNALVLDDANSTIGVLGSNWASVPRGRKGESFVHAAAGGFYFMAIEPPQESNPATGNSSPEVRVLATHTYDTFRRESTGWVDMGGVQVPVDAGVEHNGIKVYVTMMFDVIAIDTTSFKTIWSMDWNKSEPIWQTISILEIDTMSGKTLAVELAASNGEKRVLALENGKIFPDQQRSISENAPVIVPVQKDGDEIRMAVLENPGDQRSPLNLINRFRELYMRTPQPGHGNWVTDEESLVSSERPNYILGDQQTPLGMDAMEVVFNLPEGSDIRAEFSGDNVTMEPAGDVTTVTLRNGRIKLIDISGVCRADASADGGADLLIAECKRAGEEYTMRLRTGWSGPDKGSGPTPVQVKFDLAAGARKDEEQPPHRAVRYRLKYDANVPGGPMAIKMQWLYDLKRLANEAVQQSGQSWEELLEVLTSGGVSPRRPPDLSNPQLLGDSIPQQSFAGLEEHEDTASTEEPETPWGAVAEHSGRQSRLVCQTKTPAVGQPLLFRMELRNAGDDPAKFDPQEYAPFRVLRAHNADGKAAPFIGTTPQTSASPVTLEPGEVTTLWEDIDVAELFLLGEGRYEFFADGGEWATQTIWRDSNTVTVEIQPGSLAPRQSLISNLFELELRPEGWEVSSGHGAIYLSHSPSNLKRDVTTIQLWFTEHPLPADFRLGEGPDRQEVTTIGRCEAGYLHVAGPPRAKELWPEYLRDIRVAAARALNFSAGPDDPAKEPEIESEKAEETDKPWLATGRVTDADGKPLPGVTVRAHTGMGTLRNTGTAVTDADGKYELKFGPGIWSVNRKFVQAATISVSLAGHTEKNLHRQGDCVAAFEMPDGEIGWGGKTADDLILPGKPKEIDFVMVPATSLTGIVIGEDGDKLDGVRVSLRGEDMPPSSSVVVNTTTDKGGRFELTDIPVGYKWQLLIEPAKAESPWLGWASAPMSFRHSGDGRVHLDYKHEGKEFDLSLDNLQIVLSGSGVNWKSALADAATKALVLKWDGLSTDTEIHAGMASLTLGQ